MKGICAACSICSDMPPQKRSRQLYFQDEGAPILVLDDSNGDSTEALRVAKLLLGEDTPFTYTTTVRCTQRIAQARPEALDIARRHCAVWTHLLTDNRMVILATQAGLRQMSITKDIKQGSTVKSVKWGLVLCIPPLYTMKAEDIKHYTAHVRRVLLTAGLIAKAVA